MCDFPADLETPVSVYLKLARGGGTSFLLESVEGGEQVGRYSFLGVDAGTTLTVRERRLERRRAGRLERMTLLDEIDPLRAIRDELAAFRPVIVPGLPRFTGGAVGYLGYELVHWLERIPEAARPGIQAPDALLALTDTLIVFDHVRHRLSVLVNVRLDGNLERAYADAVNRIEELAGRLRQPLVGWENRDQRSVSKASGDPPPLVSNFQREEFEAAVRQAQEYIGAGDIFQVVLSQRLSRPTTAEPFAIYRALRMLNPSPYMFFLRFSDLADSPDDPQALYLIGASPEMLVRLDGDLATVRPIAGTRRRGETSADDQALESELLADPKERAEHVMLVDLGRNDLGRVCQYGTVRASQVMTVERYSHVMHLVSSVEGRLRPEMTAFDLLRATFPAGTVSGAPKVRAMEIISALEGNRRGPYAGAVGYFSTSGDMDMCITIRTLAMVGDTVYIQAGAGVVADSDPGREYEETLAKARALGAAVENAERGGL
jgi:anthranilate synthase component 1